MKPLTIWIPTYRRPRALEALLASIDSLALTDFADIVVSDNDPDGAIPQALFKRDSALSHEARYRSNVANLSAGVNFLRAFEVCSTPWLMIVGDDDLFSPVASNVLQDVLSSVPSSVVAIKFDSSLYGAQAQTCVSGLADYVSLLRRAHYADAFNNLCLVSNWIFRSDLCRNHLASAYLGYSSKVSHLFPALQACALDGGQLLFLPSVPILHGKSAASSWPKAATWYEMVMTLATFSGFIESADRRALLTLIFHRDWRRNIVKCLRVQNFYAEGRFGASAFQIHCHLAFLSASYGLALFLSAPLLILPQSVWPRFLLEKLGDPGSIDRW